MPSSPREFAEKISDSNEICQTCGFHCSDRLKRSHAVELIAARDAEIAREAKRARPKFRVGQVVIPKYEDEGAVRPIKLFHRDTTLGILSWSDTWGNGYEEWQLRPLTDREIGPRPKRRSR